jgi:hypothetical protein
MESNFFARGCVGWMLHRADLWWLLALSGIAIALAPAVAAGRHGEHALDSTTCATQSLAGSIGLEAACVGPATTTLAAGHQQVVLRGDLPSLGSDGSGGDNFGYSVALSGQVAVFGAPNDAGAGSQSGSAYVFGRSGGAWALQAKLVANGVGTSDGFGVAVAIDGDTIVVGAPRARTGPDAGSMTGEGAVYVFERTGTSWVQRARLLAADGLPGDFFGHSVAIDGDTIAVGAFAAQASTGAVYVFNRMGSVWDTGTRLTAAPAAFGAAFGFSTALEGDRIAVGEPDGGRGADREVGAVHVFERTGGSWAHRARLQPEQIGPYTNFGSSVALRGGQLLAGAPGSGPDTAPFRGSAFVFSAVGSGWSLEAELVPASAVARNRFGATVLLHSGFAILGAAGDTVVEVDQQRLQVFQQVSGVWSERGRVASPETAERDNFGFAAAFDGASLLVGSWNAAVQFNSGQGAVDAFTLDASGWRFDGRLTSGVGPGGATFGTAVAIDDTTVIVGAPTERVGANPEQGAVYVFTRSGRSWTRQARITVVDGGVADHFGAAVAVAGDALVVGAPGTDVGFATDQGAAYVFERQAGTWTRRARLAPGSSSAYAAFGAQVAIDGDRALVGAPLEGPAIGVHQGAAYMFRRSNGSWALETRFEPPNPVGSRFGTALALDLSTAVVTSGFGVNIFTFRDGIWTQTAQLASPEAISDRFGAAIGLKNGVLVVGAPSAPAASGQRNGAVYAYVDAGAAGWLQEAKLDGGAAAQVFSFGTTLAIHDGRLAVGLMESLGTPGSSGPAIQLFHRSATGWEREGRDLNFGDDLIFAEGPIQDLSGDTLVVGGPAIDGSPPFGNPSDGAALVLQGIWALFGDDFEGPATPAN